MSAESRQRLFTMWEEGGHTLPVYVYSRDTQARTEGTFMIDGEGKKKIITAEGVCMDPADFEKHGGRPLSRNWQMTISISGEHSVVTIKACGQRTVLFLLPS